MTKFSFEVPYKHLEDFHDLQDFYFILTLQYKDAKFKEFMQNVMIKGLHSIWVDNSFNEVGQATHHHDLLEVFNAYRAQKLIPPDALGWTPNQIIDQVREVARHDIPYWKMSIVAHSFKVLMAIHTHIVQATCISLPYMTRADWTKEDLQWAHSHYNTHYLGLNTIEEIVQYKPLSCDTGMPIKLALQNKSLQQWQEEGCPHIYNKDLGEAGQDYFNAQLTPDQLDLARRNICQLKEKCQ